MGDETTPLLQVSVNHPEDEEEVSPEVARDVRSNLQQALYRHPREAIMWLDQHGVKKIGTFKVQNQTVKDLLADQYAMRTFGSEERDIDWEKEWRHRLSADRPPTSGRQTTATALTRDLTAFSHGLSLGILDNFSTDSFTTFGCMTSLRAGPGWTPVTEVDAFVVNFPHAADADDDGIVNPLLKRYMDNVCGIKVFAYPATKAVLNFKWNTWARRYLAVEMADYIVWLVAFQAFVLLLQDEDMRLSTKQLVESPRGIITVALECLSYLAMLPFVYIEIRSIEEYRESWLNAWNTLDVLAYANQTAILIMHLGRLQVDSNWFSILCAIQVLLLWLRLQYFARVLQPTRQPFMETLRAVISEVKWFLLLLVLLVIAFANSFNILFRKDQEKQEFRTVWRSAVTMFTVMMSGYEVDLYSQSHNPVVSILLLMLFVFIMSMVLLNCLIALMSDAAAKVNDMEGWQFMLSRAQIIDELETTVPVFLKRRNAGLWYPKYVHFLTLNRDYENLKRLDVGGSTTIEDPDPEEEAEDSKSGDKDGSDSPKDSKPSQTDLQKQLHTLGNELEDAKAQIARLLQLQEAIARKVLPRNEARALLDAE